MKYEVSRKIVSCQVHEFANIDDMIRAFQPTILAEGFTVQFLHKDFNDYVDLDSPIQLEDRKNNKLIVISNKSANNMQRNNEKKVCNNYGKDSSESEESESESEHSL